MFPFAPAATVLFEDCDDEAEECHTVPSGTTCPCNLKLPQGSSLVAELDDAVLLLEPHT